MAKNKIEVYSRIRDLIKERGAFQFDALREELGIGPDGDDARLSYRLVIGMKKKGYLEVSGEGGRHRVYALVRSKEKALEKFFQAVGVEGSVQTPSPVVPGTGPSARLSSIETSLRSTNEKLDRIEKLVNELRQTWS